MKIMVIGTRLRAERFASPCVSGLRPLHEQCVPSAYSTGARDADLSRPYLSAAMPMIDTP